MNYLLILYIGFLTAVSLVEASISGPIATKPLDIASIKDPLRRIDRIQIGLTGANTQVFDKPNLILNPPSRDEFDRWNLPFKLAIKEIRSMIPELTPVCDQLLKTNQALEQFFFIVYQEKSSYDIESVERYEMLIKTQKDSFGVIDNSFKAFRTFYEKKIQAQELELAADDGLWTLFFGTEDREQELISKRQSLVLTRIILETFRAIIGKLLEKDIPAAREKLELSIESLQK